MHPANPIYQTHGKEIRQAVQGIMDAVGGLGAVRNHLQEIAAVPARVDRTFYRLLDAVRELPEEFYTFHFNAPRTVGGHEVKERFQSTVLSAMPEASASAARATTTKEPA